MSGDDHRMLLACAWLHDIGYALPGDAHHAVVGARALRRAGHETVARVVAHHSRAAARIAANGGPPLEGEFPIPEGTARRVLDLLDVADLLTGPHGERVDPAARLGLLVARRGTDHPSVHALVVNVTRLGEDPTLRVVVEALTAEAVAA